MFSVPGWNLSAKVATQVEKPKPKDPSKEGKKAKKRRQKQEAQIDGENVGEYWEKIVEGKEVKNPETSDIAKDEVEQVDDGAQEKRGKKRKRKGDKGAKDTAEGSEQPVVESKDTEAGAEAPIADTIAPKDGESKRDKKKRKKDKSEQKSKPAVNEVSTAPAPVSLLPPEPAGLTPLQKSMRLKLASARFRHLNEALYTKPSAESLSIFKEDPSMFEDYHRGFAQQVEVWPENPVDSYVHTILTRGKARTKDPWKDKKRKEKKGKSDPNEEIDSTPTHVDGKTVKPLPRNFKGHSTIADLGCGTASLSYRLQPQLKNLNITLHSFDLSKPSGPSGPLVTVADISFLPLPDSSVDVAIFCLALMGTNWLDFIDEAYRILRWRGELWISEIKSRFGRVERGGRKAGQPPINSIGSLRKPDKKAKGKKKDSKPEDDGIQGSDDETELAQVVDGQEAKEGTDVSSFVAVLQKHGFVLDALPERQSDAVDLSNKMFVKLQFVKGAQPTRGKNAKKDGERDGARGGLKMGIKGKKFTAIADEEGGDDEADGKTLKPCLYKIR
ncbi:hypothetical protein CC80DRAFT_488933 [Byssothecium circinans]|uniref:Ribosomal RNA-processing protein 8 n=1 Tax=Byssothecium circinans TaxID=147558 RepID=A0A6A5U6V6_9PLEO|nr:hypothetical protein CC80DRAFT_488933 [Byssothecium circinans]